MFHKIIFSLFLTVSFLSCLHAQTAQKDTSKYLHIGDTIPNFEFQISGYKTKTAKMSDFRGKPVILDLWGVFCSSCISGMPHMEELQRQFGDSIRIILVTRDAPEKVAALKRRSEILKTVKLPFIVGDNTPAKYFDYTVVPQHIWIDKNGVIKAIANAEEANFVNVRNFIIGKNIQLNEKKDFVINHDIPLINNWYPFYKNIGIYSYLTPAQNDYTTNSFNINLHIDSSTGKYRMSLDYTTIPTLYKIGYGFMNDPLFNILERIVVQSQKSKSLFESIWDRRNRKNIFTYELIADTSISPVRILRYIHSELDLYANVKSNVIKHNVKCLIFRYFPDNLHHCVVPDTNSKGGYWQNGIFKVVNLGWSVVLKNIANSKNCPYQIINESNISKDSYVSLTFNSNLLKNIPLLNKELESYGLSVTLEDRMLDCIVIEDAKEE